MLHHDNRDNHGESRSTSRSTGWSITHGISSTKGWAETTSYSPSEGVCESWGGERAYSHTYWCDPPEHECRCCRRHSHHCCIRLGDKVTTYGTSVLLWELAGRIKTMQLLPAANRLRLNRLRTELQRLADRIS